MEVVADKDPPKEWIAFESTEVFERGRTEGSSSRRRGRSRTSRGESVRSSSRSFSKWMQKPVRGDASWVPVAAPSRDHTASSQRHEAATDATALQPIKPKKSDAKNPVPSRDLRPSSVHNILEKTRSHSVHSSRSAKSADKVLKTSSESHEKSSFPVSVITTEKRIPPRRGRSSTRHSSGNSASGKSVKSASAGSVRRGRTSSRPPPTRVPSERARSRSASLTRVTSPRAPPVLNSPSAKSNKSGRRPPTASRTRQELRATRRASLDSHPDRPGLPPKATSRSEDGENDTKDTNIGREFSFGHDLTASSSGSDSSGRANPPKVTFKEKLFGTQGDASCRGSFIRTPESLQIRPRVLLAATVYHNTATNLWITTINTNQRGVAKNPKVANKYLKAFSFPTEREARESAIANAPPKMVPFDSSPSCFVCHCKFAVFKRACHCRNCGVSICSSCSITWSSKNIPETYNLKSETNVKVCPTCDTLNSGFRRALQQGDYEDAVALYGTGNINLRSPFAVQNKKAEVLYPIHAAVEGGNLKLLRWLLEDHYCPTTATRSSKNRSRSGSSTDDILIMTSKGRTVLSIAMQRANVSILRYLIVERGVSAFSCTSLEDSLRSLEATLLALPATDEAKSHPVEHTTPRWDQAYFDDTVSEPSSLGDEEVGTLGGESRRSSRTKSSRTTNGGVKERCIICMDRSIDCVATPCGHQVSCLRCSANLTKCPICKTNVDFIKIFRA